MLTAYFIRSNSKEEIIWETQA